jgi:hypothetical protein
MNNNKNNDELKHTNGGTTTRDDATDLGVPMLPAKPGEKQQGPEDALDPNTRGDYSNRQGTTNSFQITQDVPGYGKDPKPVRVVSQDETIKRRRQQ